MREYVVLPVAVTMGLETEPESDTKPVNASSKKKGAKPKCNICAKTFQSISSKNRHVRNVHSKSINKAIECELCSKTFSSPSGRNRHYLTQHKQSHKAPGKPEGKFQCSLCLKLYMSRKILLKHTKKFHGEVWSLSHVEPCSACKSNDSSTQNEICCVKPQCHACDASFSSCSDLISHNQKAHHNVAVKPRAQPSIFCKELNCGKSFSTLKKLIEHLKSHGIIMTLETQQLPNFAFFKDWKEKLEVENSVDFVQSQLAEKTKVGDRIYYYCSRSGKAKNKSGSSATKKIDGYCTAHMSVLVNVDGTVSAKYCLSHYDHEVNVKFLKVPKSEKLSIAQKLQKGASTGKIIKEYQAKSQKEKVKRVHLLNKSDVENIKRKLSDWTSNTPDESKTTEDLKTKMESKWLQILSFIKTEKSRDILEQLDSKMTDIINFVGLESNRSANGNVEIGLNLECQTVPSAKKETRKRLTSSRQKSPKRKKQRV